MKAYVIQSLIGIFALDGRGKLIDKVLFPMDPNKIMQRLTKDELTEEEVEIIEKLKKRGYNELVSSKKNEAYGFEQENLGERAFRQQFRILAKQSNFSDIELNKLITYVGIELTKKRTKEGVKKDNIVVQAIGAIDELDKSLNILIARLREWYGLHFPEMDRIIEKHEKFAKIVSEYGLRENIKEKELLELKEKSMGVDLSEEDGNILNEYATRITELYKLREHLEKYVDHIMKEIAPNTRELAGPVIGARLIALVGGLDKLAKKPSSTIQLLGAEKALFRYLRGKGRSPKYGILFTHPMVQNAPQDKKGKIARVVSSKISIAAKLDFYGKKEKSRELKEDLEKKIKKILAG